jgi:MHS family alpha-ketoglutarate permease-like MFS transporter
MTKFDFADGTGVSHEEASLSNVLRKRSLVAAGIGNTLEWFDWTIFAVFSPYIAKALFDPKDPVSALLGTLAILAAGFVARPMGGIVLGMVADRIGRKGVLLGTMILMGLASLMIGIAPGYAQIGGISSLLVLVARLLQGFAHGGESTASYTYLAEIAPNDQRAFWSSSMYFCAGIGTLSATLTGSILTNFLGDKIMYDWGWRVPFILGAGLSLAVLYLRRGMVESELMEQQTQRAGVRPSIEWSREKIIKRAVGVFFYQAGTALPYHVWTAYAAVFAITQRQMDPADAFTASVFALLVNIVMVPIWGRIADRIGRKPVTLFYYLSTAALTFPLMALISDDPWTLFTAQSIMLGISACIGGTQPAIIAERIPTLYRARVMGLAMPLSIALFGGTAPYLTSWFYGQGLGWIFNTYVMIVCFVSAAVVMTWKETRGIDLRDVE